MTPSMVLQAPPLHEDDDALIGSLVEALGETIASSYAAVAAASSSGGSRSGRPSPDFKSLVAATAFDDLYRDRHAAESSGASGS